MMVNDNYKDGLAVRRAVLGDEYVDAALENSSRVLQEFQEFITTYCWGGCWTDSRLSARDRSLLTMAITGTLGRREEFKLHSLGALRNGVREEELIAFLRHIAVYSGVPAAVNCSRDLHDALQVFGSKSDGATAEAGQL